jgi:hypothetical protein
LKALAGEQVAQPKLVGPPLPDELIAHATGTDLALPFAGNVELLLEILTVPAQPLEVLSPLLEDRVKAPGGRFVAHAPGPGFTRPERGQVVAAEEARHAVQGLVVGVPLVVLEKCRRARLRSRRHRGRSGTPRPA